MYIQVEVIFKGNPYKNSFQLWEIISTGKFKLNGSILTNELNGELIEFSEVADFLMANNLDGFEFSIGNAVIDFSYNADCNLSRLSVADLFTTDLDIEDWIKSVIKIPFFVQARIFDRQYNLWQIMDDIQYYELEGRDHSSLPKISNNLPFPLLKEVIDLSKSPGRVIFTNGYIEFIGSTMWISKNLLKELGVNLKELLELSFLSVSDLGDVLKLKSYDTCFVNSVGVQADIQNQLRKVLYESQV